VDQGCKAKRCNPKPGTRTEPADASSSPSPSSSSSSSQEMEDVDDAPALDAGVQEIKSHKRKIADLETKNAALEYEVHTLKNKTTTLCEANKELKGKLARISNFIDRDLALAPSDDED
jgi:predicted  nucleic acid-binding Zn-ribbon protein